MANTLERTTLVAVNDIVNAVHATRAGTVNPKKTPNKGGRTNHYHHLSSPLASRNGNATMTNRR